MTQRRKNGNAKRYIRTVALTLRWLKQAQCERDEAEAALIAALFGMKGADLRAMLEAMPPAPRAAFERIADRASKRHREELLRRIENHQAKQSAQASRAAC